MGGAGESLGDGCHVYVALRPKARGYAEDMYPLDGLGASHPWAPPAFLLRLWSMSQFAPDFGRRRRTYLRRAAVLGCICGYFIIVIVASRGQPRDSVGQSPP